MIWEQTPIEAKVEAIRQNFIGAEGDGEPLMQNIMLRLKKCAVKIMERSVNLIVQQIRRMVMDEKGTIEELGEELDLLEKEAREEKKESSHLQFLNKKLQCIEEYFRALHKAQKDMEKEIKTKVIQLMVEKTKKEMKQGFMKERNKLKSNLNLIRLTKENERKKEDRDKKYSDLLTLMEQNLNDARELKINVTKMQERFLSQISQPFTLSNQNRNKQVEKLKLEVIKGQEMLLDLNHQQTLIEKINYAYKLLNTNRNKEAENLILEVIDQSEAILGPNNRIQQNAMKFLQQLP